jgi:hypothetical protein
MIKPKTARTLGLALPQTLLQRSPRGLLRGTNHIHPLPFLDDAIEHLVTARLTPGLGEQPPRTVLIPEYLPRAWRQRNEP